MNQNMINLDDINDSEQRSVNSTFLIEESTAETPETNHFSKSYKSKIRIKCS